MFTLTMKRADRAQIPPSPQAKDITRFIDTIQSARRGIDQETPGWFIRRPTLADIEAEVGILYAQSKADSIEPLTLPAGIEVCIHVIVGAIRIDGFAGDIHSGQFFVVRKKDARTIRSIAHPTRIMCIFANRRPRDGSQISGFAAA